MKNKNYLPLYFSLAVILGITIGVLIDGNSNDLLSFSKNASQEQKIKKLINFIDRDYVDEVNTEELLDNTIQDLLGKLDPHSVYIPKERMQANIENLEGKFVGIGVLFRMVEDTITVIQPIKGGPSIKAGIKSGDRILMANNDTLFGKNYLTSVIPKYLKGKPKTKVDLKVYRKSNDSIFNVNLTRGDVNIKSVDLSYMIDDDLGYIKIERFAQNTYREFKAALRTLKSKGMTSLVLDLRGNGGGFIHIANRILDEFLEEDKLMVFTKSNDNRIQNYFATSIGSFEDGGLFVLMDEGSASASEIVAGALQDNDKGTIIGRRSFGKGLVQEEKELGDGSAVRLTIARYYTPTGRSIQKPYSKDGDKNYFLDYQKRLKSGELLNKDSITVNDSLKYTTPKGKVVYGGGGIIPDVFVPIDTTSYMTQFYFNTIMGFSFDYVDSNRKELENWSIEEFVEKFDKDEKIYDSYLNSIKDRAKPSFRMRKNIKRYLKASIGRDLFGDEAYYRVLHKNDNMILKVLELESKKE